MSSRPVSTKKVSSGGGASRDGSEGGSRAGRPEIIREFIWDIVSISARFEEIQYMLAQILGISAPQWMILMAINDLDRGNGVSVRVVSAKLHVDPSFVTTQSKSLEKHGFVRRITSTEDARVVLMSLTDKACKQIANLSSRQDALNDFIFSEFDDRGLAHITGSLTALKTRLEKAALRFAAEI